MQYSGGGGTFLSYHIYYIESIYQVRALCLQPETMPREKPKISNQIATPDRCQSHWSPRMYFSRMLRQRMYRFPGRRLGSVRSSAICNLTGVPLAPLFIDQEYIYENAGSDSPFLQGIHRNKSAACTYPCGETVTSSKACWVSR